MAAPAPGTTETGDAIAALLSQLPPLSMTYGALLLGSFSGFILYGLFLHQTYRYFRVYPSDPSYIKFMVIIVLLLETVHVIITAHLSYYHLVTAYFNPLSLFTGGWSVNLLPFLSGLTIVASQIFSIRRVSLIGPKQAFVAAVVSFFLLGEMALGISSTAKAFEFGDARGVKTVTYLCAIGLGLVGIADTILTTVLILAIRKSRAGYDRIKTGESLFAILQLYFVNTGVLTGVFNFIAFVVALARPTYLLMGAFSIVVTRLYGVTLLAILNTRQLRGMELFTGASVAVSIARARREASKDLWNTPKVPESTPTKIDIHIMTEMEGLK